MFAADDGLVPPPLGSVVNFCRDSQLRRHAVRLVDRAACRNGFWDSSLMARLGNVVIGLDLT